MDFDAESYQGDYKQCWRARRVSAYLSGYEGKTLRAGQFPEVLGRPWSYRCGLIVPSQVVIVAALERTTASANEQKKLTPVWFTPTGVATTW